MGVLAVYVQGNTVQVGVERQGDLTTAAFALSSNNPETTAAQQLLPWLQAAGVSQDSLEFIVTNGALQEKGPRGVYLLYAHLQLVPGWGGSALAQLLGKRFSCPIYLVDPASAGECHPHALVTGIPAIQRACLADHFLLKYLARQGALRRGLEQGAGRFIVAHLDEVHQLGAVAEDQVWDCLTSADEGPFALRHSGGLPFDGILDLCSAWRNREAALAEVVERGGLKGYLHVDRLADLYTQHGEGAELVRQALVYQTAKEIAALAVVLHGQVDAIVCAGELVAFEPFRNALHQRVSFIAPLIAMPGSQGVQALLAGAERIRNHEPVINRN